MKPVCPCDLCKQLGNSLCKPSQCSEHIQYEARLAIWHELTKEFHREVRRREYYDDIRTDSKRD